MSNPNLSDIATKKLQQIHQLVIQFQALESDLKDVFEEIESKHRAEKKELIEQVNQLKGIDKSENNDNKLFGAVKLKPNPLNQQQQQQPNLSHSQSMNHYPSPRQHQSHHQNNYKNANNNYNPHSQNQQRNPNGSVHQKFSNLPHQIAPNQATSHYKNRTPLSYQQQQQQRQQYNNNNTQHNKQTRSHGNGMVPPPPSMPYGQKPLPKNNGYGSNKPHVMNNNDDKKDNNNNKNNKKKINLLPDPPKNKDKPKTAKTSVFAKFLASSNNKSTNSDLNDLGSGISERDFYKKYWIEAGKIGEGAFARVRKITRKSDKAVFALKMIKKKGKSTEDIAALQREILVLQKCDHENIVRLGDWCDTKKRIYMVVEFCDGGDVFERVVQYKKFSEKSAIHVVKQVSSGLKHIHSLNYVHRDLKPDNLMYLTKDIDSKIKIIDFGLAGDCNNGKCKTPCGTAHYAAPEVLSSQEYDMMSDLWSLGVIIYTLLCGFPPFFDASNNMKNLYHLIKKGQYSFPSPFWDDITDLAKDLITKLLVKDPSKRLNATQVLEHGWITQAKNQVNDKDLGADYTKQMSHWQSTRQATEFGLGQDAAPPPPPAQPIPLYYNQQQQNNQQQSPNTQPSNNNNNNNNDNNK